MHTHARVHASEACSSLWFLPTWTPKEKQPPCRGEGVLGEEVQLGLLRTASSWLFSWVSFYREQLEHHQATSFFFFFFCLPPPV